MTKKQKIWMGIFSAMFVIPEILWSPIGNLTYDFFQNSNNVEIFRPNFLTIPDNISLLIYVLCVQFVGILGLTISTIRTNISSKLKLFLIPIMIIILCATSFILYTVFSLRHGIGF